MEKSLVEQLSQRLGVSISKIRPISGGDISKAYVIDTQNHRFFCKLHYGTSGKEMFLAEKFGLEAIAATKTIHTPEIHLCKSFNGTAVLVLDFIDSKRVTDSDWRKLGSGLAALHKTSSATFGWKTNNYIGSLPQENTIHIDWATFYIKERLMPQFEMAKTQALLSTGEVPSKEEMIRCCNGFFDSITPSLLHGDLWSGNFLIASDGIPYLIDPAVYFGHNEVDLSMSRLFGGFDSSFYNAYNEHFPTQELEQERKDIYQLYYLLVHLNMFGKRYYPEVKQILTRYFK